jgi:hypothetical protein
LPSVMASSWSLSCSLGSLGISISCSLPWL